VLGRLSGERRHEAVRAAARVRRGRSGHTIDSAAHGERGSAASAAAVVCAERSPNADATGAGCGCVAARCGSATATAPGRKQQRPWAEPRRSSAARTPGSSAAETHGWRSPSAAARAARRSRRPQGSTAAARAGTQHAAATAWRAAAAEARRPALAQRSQRCATERDVDHHLSG